MTNQNIISAVQSNSLYYSCTSTNYDLRKKKKKNPGLTSQCSFSFKPASTQTHTHSRITTHNTHARPNTHTHTLTNTNATTHHRPLPQHRIDDRTYFKCPVKESFQIFFFSLPPPSDQLRSQCFCKGERGAQRKCTHHRHPAVSLSYQISMAKKAGGSLSFYTFSPCMVFYLARMQTVLSASGCTSTINMEGESYFMIGEVVVFLVVKFIIQYLNLQQFSIIYS